ncbi:MAG: hypothetical protein ACTSQE_15455 [Candidatus Heimdallarchaeaceae archaeon]
MNEETKKKETDEQENKRKPPFIVRISFGFLTVLFTIISLGGHIVLTIYDILVPRALRELVPILNMFRKYILIASELLSGKKGKEVIEVATELEEIKMREEKVTKNYPVRRGLGEAINLGLHPVIMFAIPTAIWGEDLHHLFESWGIPVSLGILLFGTGLLCISWIATIFGPIYALFHECSMFMLRRKSYRWAEIFQDLENLFALPYYTARSSFSILDAPPISAETFQDFKLDIMDDLQEMKDRVQDLLALDAKQVPDRSKRMLEDLLKKTQKSLGSLDINEITEETARTFSLLIWNKEGSFLPWRRNEALERFAEYNGLSFKEAKKTIEIIALKTLEGYTSKDLYFSIMLTGALKGIASLEKRYEHILCDLEYTSIALSLALGAHQYILDKFIPTPWIKKVWKSILDSLIALVLPYYILILSIFNYFKHIVVQTGKDIVGIKDLRRKKIISSRYREIKDTLNDVYFSLGEKNINFKEELDIDFKAFFKKFGKFLLKLLLIIPLLFWSLIKTLYITLKKLWARRTEEEKNKRQFEKELATEVLASMYQEIYEKIVLADYGF